MRTQEELEALHRAAEAEFKKYPGVIGVGYGYKEKNGQTTQQLSFRVYVEEKKSKASLNPAEQIPAEFNGIPTDIIKAPRRTLDFAGCEDQSTDSPLVSGITLTNFKKDATGLVKLGTLGFFATIDGVKGPDNVVLVSNNHVLLGNNAANDEHLYRPKFLPDGRVDEQNLVFVSVISNVGMKGNFNFSYDASPETPFFVDAATGRINICMSSWCHTNCGTSFDNKVKGFHIAADTSNKITDFKRLQHSDLPANGDYVVYKVGRQSGLTVGKVTEILLTPNDAEGREGIIEIEATQKTCDNTGATTQFAIEGDSGAALLNDKRELIGVVFGGPEDNLAKAYACHIHPVLKKLGVTPITAAQPHTAAGAFSDAPGIVAGSEDRTLELREQVFSSVRGRQLIDLVEAHRGEVVQLVNHCRPVTVAWHRNKGPMFMAHAIQGVRDPSHQVPHEVEGIKLDDLLTGMHQVLNKHGSVHLRNALDAHAVEVHKCAESFDNPHDVVSYLDPGRKI